jgi:hypothetical protein
MIQMSKHFQKELDLAIKILKEAGCQEIFIFGSLATLFLKVPLTKGG